jgi:hypothetical protein
MIKPLSVARMYRGYNKSLYFIIKQMKHFFKEYDIKVYALIDNEEDTPYKSEILNNINITVYNKEDVHKLFRCYYTEDETEGIKDNLSKYPWVYNLYLDFIIANENKDVNYILHYDDDIVIFDRDLQEIKCAIDNKQPFAIREACSSCDISLVVKLSSFYNTDLLPILMKKNPTMKTLNCGFMGVNLNLYRTFLEYKNFRALYNMFCFNPSRYTYSFMFCQEQSFHILINVCLNDDFIRMDNKKYIFDNPFTSKSKIRHFTGDKHFSKEYEDIIEAKLLEIGDKVATINTKLLEVNDNICKIV